MLPRKTNVCLFHSERETVEEQRAARSLSSAPPLPAKHQEEKIHTMVHMQNVKVGICTALPVGIVKVSVLMLACICVQCLLRHFSGWYSVVLNRRLRMSKAMALYEWKRKLKAWRGWRAVVWAEQKQQVVARTEQELRAENRQEPKRNDINCLCIIV